MLQSMRDKMQGLVAGTIAVIIALTFVLWGVQNYLRTGSETQVVAKVNGKKITRAQENIVYEQLKRSQMAMLGQDFSLDQKTQAQLRKSVRQHLVKQEVLDQAMVKMGLGIGQEQLWMLVRGLPIFQVNGHFSSDQFHQIVSRVFYSQQFFFDGIKHSFLQAQLEAGIINSAFALPAEVTNIKNMFKQRRNFGYVIVTPERFAARIQIDPAMVQKYYEQHKNEFILPEKVSLQYIEFSAAATHKHTQVSEEQLKQYYQSHANLFATPKKWQVIRVLLPLSPMADPKVIDAAKKKLLQLKATDDWTRVTGVQVNKIWLTKAAAGSELAVQLDQLSVGQMSKPFRTKEGYNVSKILAIQPEVVIPYKAVAAKVKQAYENQQSAQLFAEANDRLIDLAYTNPDSLEPAAKEFGLKIQVTDLVTSSGAKSGILANSKFIKAAFGEAFLKHGYNSNPIEIEPGKLVVLRLKDHIFETVQTLDQVRSVIMEKLKTQEMLKKAYDFSQELVVQLRQGKSGPELVRQHGLMWQEVNDVGYYQQRKDTQLVEAVFNLSKPQTNTASVTMVDFQGGYAVLQLFKVYASKSSSETTKEIDILKSLPGRWGQFDYHILVTDLMNKSKIKISEEV